jgi:hypothetical protein
MKRSDFIVFSGSNEYKRAQIINHFDVISKFSPDFKLLQYTRYNISKIRAFHCRNSVYE